MLSLIRSCKEDNKTINANLSSETERSKQFEKELASLKTKLAKGTAQNLSLEKGNKKLKKKTLENISREKITCEPDNEKEGTSVHIETKIETEFQELKDTLLRRRSIT